MPSKPVSASIWRVNLSMRVAVVGPAGPMTSSRTGRPGNVVNKAAGEIDGELLAAAEHFGHALVGGVAAGEQLPVSSSTSPASTYGSSRVTCRC